MITGYSYSSNDVSYNGTNYTQLTNTGCTKALNGYSDINGGVSGAVVNYNCNNTRTDGIKTTATITASGCFAPCTSSISNGTPTSSFTLNSGTVVWLHNTIATCNSGYSSSPGSTNPTCNNGSWIGSCNINTCTPPTNVPIGYTLPGGFTYNYTTTATAITGVACATGYYSSASTTPTLTYTCNNTGSSSPISAINVSASGCTPITCSVPTGFNTANIFYISTGGTLTELTSTTNNLPYLTTRGGLTCASGYSPSSLGYTCATAGQTTISGSCTPRCEWLGLVGSQWQWVDAITQAGCGSCTTFDGCKNWKCVRNPGGVYRWDRIIITCP